MLKFFSSIGKRKWNPQSVKAFVYVFSLIIFLVASILFYCNYEGWSADRAIGFAIVTLCTVGYGYDHPSDDTSRLFTIFFMLFGVYFVFFGLNEVITNRMNNMKTKGFGEEKIVVSRRRFFLNIIAIFSVLVLAAFAFMAMEDWTFITALYFAIQTTATIGFGDIEEPSRTTRAFLSVYIIVSACLVTYLFSNLNIVKNGLKLLNEKEAQAQKRMTLEFMLKMDSGKGITEAEFVLAILEHEGIISKETHIKPWAEKFRTMDPTGTGRIYKKELSIFHRIESEQAATDLEEIRREKSESISAWPLAAAAPSASFDGGGPLLANRSDSPLHQFIKNGVYTGGMFSSNGSSADNSFSNLESSGLVSGGQVTNRSSVYSQLGFRNSDQTMPMLAEEGSQDDEKEDDEA